MVRPPSVVVLATADGATRGAQDPQDRSNHQQDDADGLQDGNACDQSHDHKHNSENDHLRFLSALRGRVRVSLEHLAQTNLTDRLVGALPILSRSRTGETRMACRWSDVEISTNPWLVQRDNLAPGRKKFNATVGLLPPSGFM